MPPELPIRGVPQDMIIIINVHVFTVFTVKMDYNNFRTVQIPIPTVSNTLTVPVGTSDSECKLTYYNYTN